MIPIIADLLKGGIQGIVGSASDIIKDFKADPTKVLETEEKLKELQLQATQATEKLQADIEQAYLKDNQSARDREVQIATSDKAPLLNKIVTPLLAIGVTLLTFVAYYYILYMPIPSGKETLIGAIVGSLTTIEMGIIGYYFGSSISSKAKDDSISKILSKNP